MSWYYAENNERLGPVDDAEFSRLVAAGRIQPPTLVWREGFANWVPLSESGFTVPTGAQPAPGPGGVEMGMCSESGRILPRSELVEIDGKLVSAEFKNVVLQRIREGVAGDGFAEDPEVIAQRIEARGWSISAPDCVGRGFALVRQNFWLTVGATFLVYLVIGAAGMIPFGGIIVQGPLLGGLFWMLLKLIRGEYTTVGDAFAGFQRGWGQLVGVSLVTTLLAVVALIPAGIALAVAIAGSNGEPSVPGIVIAAALGFFGMLFAVYLTVAWTFALPLVADKRMEFWPAMRLSKRVVTMHWWQVFGVIFLTGLMMMGVMGLGALIIVGLFAWGAANQASNGLATSLALLVGLGLAVAFVTLLPVIFGALSVAYEQIFGKREEG